MMTLSDSIAYQADCIESLKTLVDLSNGTISNQLSSINTLLTIVSITLALVGIFLGLYINNMHSRILKMKECVEESAKKTKEINEQIHSDFSSLYQQLREEETLSYLKRLEQVPEDISNVVPILLSRTLEDKHYPYLRKAFLMLKKHGKVEKVSGCFGATYGYLYSGLFHQHFLHLAIEDDEIREILVPNFNGLVKASFKNDIIKSTSDLCKSLSKNSVNYDKEIILYQYLLAINKSDYKNCSELKDILQSNIKNKSLLPDTIERCTRDNIRLELFDNIRETASDIVGDDASEVQGTSET